MPNVQPDLVSREPVRRGRVRRARVLGIVTKIAITALLTSTMLGSVLASTLDDLLPRSSIVTLGVMPGEGSELLARPFADLDVDAWTRAVDAVTPILMDLGASGGPEVLEMLASFGSLDEALSGVRDACPAAFDAADRLGDPATWVDDAVLAVVADRFDPIPGVVGVVRVAQGSGDDVKALHEAIDVCAGGSSLGTEAGVDLRIWLDGSDLPLVAAYAGDLLVLSSRPDLTRSVLRLASGSDEPSLADRVRPQGSAPERSLLRGSLDVAALADVVEALPLPIDDPAVASLLERAVGSLRTLGYGEGFLEIDAGGATVRQHWVADPNGGDAALYALLTCTDCSIDASPFVPASTFASSALAIDRNGLTAWLDGWALAATEALFGEPSTLEDVALNVAGIDLNALFGWVGDDVRAVVLDGPKVGVGDLVYGPATVVAIDAISPEAARAGLDAWRDVASTDLVALLGGLAGGGAMDSLGASDAIVEDLDVAGTPALRIRFGLNGDVAFAVIDDDLVIAQPFSALERVLAAGSGAIPSEAAGAGFDAVEASADRPWIAFEYSDVRASLDAVAEVMEALAQPVAFVTSEALAAALDANRSFGSDPYGGFAVEAGGPARLDDDAAWTSLDLGDLAVPPAPLVDAVTGALGPDTPTFAPFGDPYDFYVLPPLAPGTVVTIVLTSQAFDTYLDLVDPVTGLVLLTNDDAGGFDRSELFFEADGRDLWVGVTRFGSGDGPYELTLAIEGEERDEVAGAPEGTDAGEGDDGGAGDAAASDLVAPTLADLLPAAELPAAAVRALADRAGWFTRVVDVENGVLVDVMRWNVAW